MSNAVSCLLTIQRNWVSWAVGALCLGGFYAVSHYNFLLFHCLAEGFSIIVAVAVFTIFWNTRDSLDGGSYVVVGLGCLFAGVLDFFYLVAYKGMTVIPAADGNTAFQAKAAAQWFVSLSCVAAFPFLRRKVNQNVALLAFTAVFVVALGTIFHWRVFPTCYVDGVGMTLFSRIGQAVGCGGYLVALVLLLRSRKAFDRRVVALLAVALSVFLVEGVASLVATGIDGGARVVAHLCQVLGVYCVYQAFIEIGLRQPYDLLFRSLQESAQALECQRQFLAAVLDNVKSGIIACDANGRLTLFNRAMREVHGPSVLHLPVEQWAQQLHLYRADGKTPLKTEEVPLFRALRGEPVRDMEVTVVPSAGTPRTFVISGEALRGRNGESRGAVVVAHDITERKRAEEALRYSEEGLRLVLEASGTGWWRLEVTTGKISTDDRCKALFGLPPTVEASFALFLERISAADRALAEQRFADSMSRPGDYENEYRTVWPDGSVHWILIKGRWFRSVPGKPSYAEGIVMDVTDRKQAEAALGESVSRLHATLESTADGILVVDLEGRVVDANERFLAMWRLPKEFLVTSGARDPRVSPGDFTSLRSCIVEQLKNPQAYMARVSEIYAAPEASSFDVLECKDDRVFERYSQPQWVDGRPVGRVWSFRDVTDRNAAEQALRESEERYRVLVETIPQLAWRASHEGMIIDCNRRWYEYTGQTPVQARGHGWLAAVHADDRPRLADELRLAISGQKPFEVEYRLRRAADGSYRWHLSRAIPLLDGEGRVAYWAGSTTDIEALKQAQDLLMRAHDEQVQRHRAELAHAARLSMMGEVAASLAHELNQPLHAVHNYARGSLLRLLKRPDKDEQLVAALEQIAEEAERAAEIVRRVRLFVQKRPPQFSEVGVNELIEEVAQLTKAALDPHSQARIVLELSDDLPPVLGDAVQIEQVVMNLVRNGLEAMEELPEEERLLRIKSTLDGSAQIRIEVCDRGRGVHGEDADKVFEPFFTTKPEGMGMGLAISRSIVQAHGGRLGVVSEQEQGCVFHFTLPVSSRS